MANERQTGEQESLRKREYRDSAGNKRHHTTKYMEQHGRSSSKKGASPAGRSQSSSRSRSKSGTGRAGAVRGGRSAQGTRSQASEKGLQELFVETLKDVYSAEKQMLRAMASIGKTAQSQELRQALDTHRQETEAQVERLEQVFEMAGERARPKPCEAIKGLVEEAKEVATEFKGSDALDAGLLAAVQAVEHYEISRYGTLATWAGQLGMDPAAKLLQQTLEEEKNTDAILTKLAESSANRQAQAA